MKSRSLLWLLSALLIIVLLAGCGGAKSVSSADSEPVWYDSSDQSSDESTLPERCDPSITFHDVIIPIGDLFVWEENTAERCIIYREGLGRIYLTREEIAPEKVDLAYQRTSDDEHEYWKYESPAIGLYDCETSIHQDDSATFLTRFYVEGGLYELSFLASSPADIPWCYEWFVDLMNGIRPTDEAAAGIAASQTENAQSETTSSDTASSETASSAEEEPEEETIHWPDLIRQLNGAESSEFEALYAEAMEKIERLGLQDDWDAVCRSASAYLDYTNDEYLYEIGENYRFHSNYGPTFPGLPEGVYLSNICRALENAGLDTPLMEKIYTPGNKLRPSSAVWKRDMLSLRGYPETAPEREPGDPIRVLVVYLGDIVIVDRTGMVTLTPDYADEMIEDVTKLWDQFFADIEGASLDDASYPVDDPEDMPRVQIVTDPEQADVILRYDLEYPFAGSYGPTGGLSVYNCHVDVSIRKADETEYLQFHYEHNAGNSVSARSGSTKLWMHIPDDIDNEIGTTILSWFPDV